VRHLQDTGVAFGIYSINSVRLNETFYERATRALFSASQMTSYIDNCILHAAFKTVSPLWSSSHHMRRFYGCDGGGRGDDTWCSFCLKI